MTIVKDETATYDQMAIVEKYEQVINYCYPIFQNIPRKHGVARDMMLRTLFGQIELFVLAGKSGQVSRLYSADANLGVLRYWLHFAAENSRRLITTNQHRTAQALVAEVGAMLGAWIKSTKGRG
ncbi:diversity-generating retroelement protein Avd [Rhodopseudomonas parapalustris]